MRDAMPPLAGLWADLARTCAAVERDLCAGDKTAEAAPASAIKEAVISGTSTDNSSLGL